ncbi:hypothetical protein [Aurantimonas sp. Leaf443]|uniref:hypothetical protein n=1 Tax=Aurantimonas sp. Leaf443 TaxID=1736378 RepID=UPI0006FE5406|nr:hypothetical protein [Aurantimonas sp. Leaf443]KQT85201.1 hypothetical protein ASG48_08010 [Aurantimonas sp. Leaf443]
MALQNRVAPTGEIEAEPARGTLMGNRGILHGADRRLGPARWRHRAWIACSLAFKGRRRAVMAPGRYTELFFLDEAVALAAGHRPCAECRRADFRRFRAALAGTLGDDLPAPRLDAHLHDSRIDPATGGQRRPSARVADLPDGAFVLAQGSAHLLLGGRLLPFGFDGYGKPRRAPRGAVAVLTPALSIAALRSGYAPMLHPSAVEAVISA